MKNKQKQDRQIQIVTKMKCYLAPKKGQYTVANYLTTVTDTKLRTTLTRYRLSEPSHRDRQE